MSGHAQVGDLEQIRDNRLRERLAARAEADHRKRIEVWPTSCPVCFADPGERCITRTGKKAVRHEARR